MSERADSPVRHRLAAYARALGAPPERLEVALGAADADDPQAVLARARATLLDCAPEGPAWVAALLVRRGIAVDPARPLLAQSEPPARTPMAARPFRRTPLRRLLMGLLRPLAVFGRWLQVLGGRAAQ